MNRQSYRLDDSSGPAASGRGRRVLSQGTSRAGIARFFVVSWLVFFLFGSDSMAGSGRWTWFATASAGQRKFDTLVDGNSSGGSKQGELGLSLQADGFLGDPAVGNFSLGLDLLNVRSGGSSGSDSTRVGYAASVDFFPRGTRPIRLYARRAFYDYSKARGPFSLGRTPEESTEWGGRVRFRRGALRGLLVGLDRFEIQETAGGVDRRDREFLDWSPGRGGRFQNHVRVENRDQRYDLLGLSIEDLTINLDQTAQLSEDWRWTLSGNAIQRDINSSPSSSTSIDDYRLRAIVLHTVNDRDALAVNADLNWLRPLDAEGRDRQSLRVSYGWRPKPAWEIAPFVVYTGQQAGPESVKAPQVGLLVGWNGAWRKLTTAFTVSGSYGTLTFDDSIVSRDESQYAGGVTGSIAHGQDEGLRKVFEFEFSRNQLRVLRSPVLELPDLGLPRGGLGTENYRRVRLTLGHRFQTRTMTGWFEWNRRGSADSMIGRDLEVEEYRGTAQFGGRRFSFTANIGWTDFASEFSGDQSVRFSGVHASWNLRSFLSLRALVQKSIVDTDLISGIDAQRLEAGAVFHMGQTDIDIFAFDSTSSLNGGSETTQRSFNWRIRRRFAGWLPIVTGTQRRGTIR